MPKRSDIRKVLILGAGPAIIGQAGELDSAGWESCKALRELGYETVFVNSNPASVAADTDVADITYIEPLDVKSLEKIIDAERPDALLPFPGGQPGLRLSLDLDGSGALEKYGVKTLGVTPWLLRTNGNRASFFQAAAALGIETPCSLPAASLAEAEAALSQVDLPCLVRPSWSLSGEGAELAYNLEEFRQAVGRGLSVQGAAGARRVLVEESPETLRALAVEVLRDGKGNKIVVGFVENINGAGVHEGDAIRVMPPQTVPPEIRAALQRHSFALADALDIVGCADIQFAWAPETNRVTVTDCNPCASRTAALTAWAGGVSVFRVAALLAAGCDLGEISGGKGTSLLEYVPKEDAVAVRFPRWDFARFPGARDRLGPQMRSVGEVVGLGRTFKEALRKAVRSLEIGRTGIGFVHSLREKSLDELKALLWRGTSATPFILYEALMKGADVGEAAARTRIHPWFVGQVKELVEFEERVGSFKGREFPAELLARAKKDGFSDVRLAEMLGIEEAALRARRKELGIGAAFLPVSSSETGREVWYSTYNAPGETSVSPARKIMVVGPGPGRVGQGGEFDYCCAEAVLELESLGYEPVTVNSNPGAVYVGGKVYFEPVSAENILDIREREMPEGILIQFGGATPRRLVRQLAESGVKIFGVSDGLSDKPDTAGSDVADDDGRFRAVLEKAGIAQPAAGVAKNLEDARSHAARIGYPLMLRSSRRTDGPGREIAHDDEDIVDYMEKAAGAPVRIEKFLENAVKAEAVALTDGKDIYIPAVIEYIERAGIHSGDSACVLPAMHILERHLKAIEEYTRAIAAEFATPGLADVKYAISGDTVYVLGSTFRSDRRAVPNLPLLTKVCGIPMTRLAVRLILGAKLDDLGLGRMDARGISRRGVKETVFPFNMFPEVDPVLGPEMHSTGSALGLADSYELAFHKAEEAAGQLLPQSGTVLFSISASEKSESVELAREFERLGFRLKATEGTQKFFGDAGIACEKILKLNFGRPDIVDAIKNGDIQLVVNTPTGKRGAMDDSYIRKTAIREGVPYITTLAAARAAAKGIAAYRREESAAVPLRKAR